MMEGPIPYEVRRWLHDKFERLQAREEDRIQSWATLFISLNTGLVAVVGYLLTQYHLAVSFWGFLAATAAAGLVISGGWFLVGYGMLESDMVWREMARSLEAPPFGVVAEEISANVRLWWGAEGMVPMRLDQPVTAKDATVVKRADQRSVKLYPMSMMAKNIPKGTAVAWFVVFAVSLTVFLTLLL